MDILYMVSKYCGIINLEFNPREEGTQSTESPIKVGEAKNKINQISFPGLSSQNLLRCTDS